MKIKRFLGAFVFLIGALILIPMTLSSCKVHRYAIEFKVPICLIPYEGYMFHTCDEAEVLIDHKPFTIPKHFQTNLASVPRFLWSIMPPQYTEFIEPGVLHDYLYSCPDNVSRKFADDVLYSALRQNHISIITSYIFWLAVRLFGADYFNDNDTCQ